MTFFFSAECKDIAVSLMLHKLLKYKHMGLLRHKKRKVWQYIFWGAVMGSVYALTEYFFKAGTDFQEALLPLIVRAAAAGILFLLSINYASIYLNSKLRETQFIFALICKSVIYTLIISLVLFFINGVWFLLDPVTTFRQHLRYYLFVEQMYFVNLATIFPGMIIIIALSQIASLHRKGDLLNFILGKFNQPKEVERVFCFIDLKGSTSIAERLGNLKYAAFLKEYYSDISDAISVADAQIYQYVGDEIVLSWSFDKALKKKNMINCVIEMKEKIRENKAKYKNKFEFVPYFRAALHGGKVIVTWVGGKRKEIVYIGDVLNTASRIQSDCKRLNEDFLISGDLLEKMDKPEEINATFVEETIPRGKATKVKLFSLPI